MTWLNCNCVGVALGELSLTIFHNLPINMQGDIGPIKNFTVQVGRQAETHSLTHMHTNTHTHTLMHAQVGYSWTVS